jgi:hypothetical protein
MRAASPKAPNVEIASEIHCPTSLNINLHFGENELSGASLAFARPVSDRRIA